MSRRLNTDDQFKFLISCIRWSNNGKVDFTEVAKECKIVSKGAAAKRYERMMKAHNIHQPVHCRDTTVAPLRRKDDGYKTTAKKRKHDHFVDNGNIIEDDDEGLGSVKSEFSSPVKATIKDEAQLNEVLATTNYPWLRYSPPKAKSMEDTEADAFDEFIVSNAFVPINAPSSFEGGNALGASQGNDRIIGGGNMAQDGILILD